MRKYLITSCLGVLILGFGLLTLPARIFSQPIMEKVFEGIPYLSGGIGLDEREYLESLSGQYNLKLSFAVKAGNYLADVRIMVENSAGKQILDAMAEGPWFYTKLPAGRYTVTAQAKGKAIRKAVQVGRAGQTRLHFYWEQ